jgi:hypothetical protein
VHLSEQVARAARYGVPCALLLRAPLDAVTSLVIFERGRLSDSRALRGYIRYHRDVARHREAFVVCGFEAVLGDPQTLVHALNERFGTSFASSPLDEEGRRGLLEQIERFHRNRARDVSTFSVPADEKEAAKPAVRTRLAEHPLMAEAEAAHAALA